MSKINKILRILVHTPVKNYLVFIRVTFIFLYTKVLVKYFSLAYYQKYFHLFEQDSDKKMQPNPEVIRTIAKVIRKLPGKTSCLEECLIVHIYFRGQGIFIPIYLGIKKSDGLHAHAWYLEQNSAGFNKISM